MTNMWLLILIILGVTEFEAVATSPCQANSRVRSTIAYKDIEALNATCEKLDSCIEDRSFSILHDNLNNYNCMCGRFCVELNTCCVDSDHKLDEPQLSHHQLKCSEVYGGSESIFMVDTCKAKYNKDPSVEKLCNSNGEELNDPFLAIPVTSKKSRITYKNYYCAVCNEDTEQEPVFWNVKLTSRSKDVLSESVPELHYNTTLNSWVITNDTQKGEYSMVSLDAVTPVNVTGIVYSCHPEVIDTCSWNWTDLTIAEKCGDYMAITRLKTDEGLVLYRNPHCAICNYGDLDKMQCVDERFSLSRAPAISSKTFFVGLFSWHDKADPCEDNKVYDKLAKKCRRVYKG